MRKTTGMAAVAVLALGITGCGDGEGAPESQEEPTAVEATAPEPTPTETSPAGDPEPADPFLEGAEPHVEALDSWWEDYEDADCSVSHPDCYEVFHEGLGHLEDYEEWLTALDVSEVPDYVHFQHRGLVTRTLHFMEIWDDACPGPECISAGTGMHDRVYDTVIGEIRSW